MVEVKFYDEADDNLLKFAVIIARSDDKWVFCKHRSRNTYEIPGGHQEPGELIDDLTEKKPLECFISQRSVPLRKNCTAKLKRS